MRPFITGATGALGQALVERWLAEERVTIFSRDEFKQSQMVERLGQYANLRFRLGDVRDRERLVQAMRGSDVVVAAAALKRIDHTPYDPEEIVKTNLLGVINTIAAAIEVGVRRVVVVSSDKSVLSSNVYGGTKFLAEQYAVAANLYGQPMGTAIAAVRYGNVVNSRGAVLHRFREQARTGGPLTVTDPKMSRFVMTLPQAVDLVALAATCLRGGEVFIPRLPSMWIRDLAEAVGPGLPIEYTGRRPGGEKLGEVLISEHESDRVVADPRGDLYVLEPSHGFWVYEPWPGMPVADGFRYDSETNPDWLSVDQLRELLGDL